MIEVLISDDKSYVIIANRPNTFYLTMDAAKELFNELGRKLNEANDPPKPEHLS